jgi:hypothetical protein
LLTRINLNLGWACGLRFCRSEYRAFLLNKYHFELVGIDHRV